MFDSEQDTSVLGKRVRNEGQEPQKYQDTETYKPIEPATTSADDDDDDDVGPMPLPASAGGMQKKRKGLRDFVTRYFWALRNTDYVF